MTFFDYITLGLVQGLTEFLPVSSSGHLVLTEKLLGLQSSDVTMEITAHAGTLIAIFVAFRRDIFALIKEAIYLPKHFLNYSQKGTELPRCAKMVLFILISMIPAGLVGVFLKSFIEELFSPPIVLVMLIVTALILLSTKWQTKAPDKELSYAKALIIGMAQAFAITPGISRSGSTVVAATWLGMSREESFRFSFLMSIPVIGGACLLQIKDFLEGGTTGDYSAAGLITLLLSAAISGYGALALFRKAVTANTLHYFAYYCLAASALSFWIIL